MNIFITGGQGFIGSSLSKFLSMNGDRVTIYDKKRHLSAQILKSSSIRYVEGDLIKDRNLEKKLQGHELVYHLAANADVKRGMENRSIDMTIGPFATQRLLEAMKKTGVLKIVFPSSMTVYGNGNGKPIQEFYGPLLPISLYAASKLATESLLSAYAYTYGIQTWILRLANVVGQNMTHGVIFDLINKLIADPKRLEVLGNGYQSKPYIYIDDVINAFTFIPQYAVEEYNIYNIGTDESISVRDIVAIILEEMKLSPEVHYQITPYGWKGDVPTFSIDSTKALKLGYKPQYSSREAIKKAVQAYLRSIQFLK